MCVHVCACVCVCLYVCVTIIFESLDVGSSFCKSGMGIQVKFIYEGHRVKVKVTGEKMVLPGIPGIQNRNSRNLKLG